MFFFVEITCGIVSSYLRHPMKIFLHGHGSLSAAGCSAAAALGVYTRGESTWTVDAETGLPVYRVGDLPNHPTLVAFAESRAVDRSTELALYAAEQAVAAAGWTGKEFSILVGCSRGPTQSWETGYDIFKEEGRVPTRTSPSTTLGSPAFALADYFGVSALATGLSVTCSSGFHALLHGVALLRAGMAERVLVGGTEAPLTPFTLRQMEALRITASVPEPGEHACRPFSNPSSGMALGEGAAFFALSLDAGPFELSALSFAREAAGSATGITPEGAALSQTMADAIGQGGDPDFIVAHAPGTKRGDAAELRAIRALYKDAPEKQLISSFKWATGHTFGASGPLALDAALNILKSKQKIPLPDGNRQARPEAYHSAMINATGFGGNAVSIRVNLTPNRMSALPSPPTTKRLI